MQTEYQSIQVLYTCLIATLDVMSDLSNYIKNLENRIQALEQSNNPTSNKE
jgi:hypothetical protein